MLAECCRKAHTCLACPGRVCSCCLHGLSMAPPLGRDALDSPTTSSELRSRSRGYLDGLLTPLSGSAKKKRRHPVARLKGNWQPDEDERLIACVCTSSSQVQRRYRANQRMTPESRG